MSSTAQGVAGIGEGLLGPIGSIIGSIFGMSKAAGSKKDQQNQEKTYWALQSYYQHHPIPDYPMSSAPYITSKVNDGTGKQVEVVQNKNTGAIISQSDLANKAKAANFSSSALGNWLSTSGYVVGSDGTLTNGLTAKTATVTDATATTDTTPSNGASLVSSISTGVSSSMPYLIGAVILGGLAWWFLKHKKIK